MSAPDGSKIIFIDTNIFLRVLVKENEQVFAECREVLSHISTGIILAYTNTIVLTEIQFVLTTVYKQPREKIQTALTAALSIPTLKIIDDTDAYFALSLYGKTKIKFTDCLIASSKRLLMAQTAVLSYDHDFDKLGVKRVEPKQLL